MSTNKHIDLICLIAIVLAVGLTVAFMNGERLGLETARAVNGYESRLFDTTRVHEIDIVMNNFEELCERADKNAWFDCTALIDGEKYSNISIRVKGRASEIESAGSIKYSFKIEFDHTNTIENYHGLDKLDLNNFAGDCTHMKDFVVYESMAAAGVPAPLASYAYLTVNGKDLGLYLAVESIEDAFLVRNFGNGHGNLYKPEYDQIVYTNADLTVGKEPEIDNQGDQPIIGKSEENTGRDVTFEDPKAHVDPDVLEGADAVQYAEAVANASSGTTSDAGTEPASEDAAQGGTGAGSEDAAQGEALAGSASDGEAQDAVAATEAAQNTTEAGSDAAGEVSQDTGAGMDTSENASHNALTIEVPADVKLIYIDDESQSYPGIFKHAKQNVGERDRKRLIKAIKTLNTETNVASAVDTDEVISYFAVHNFVVSWNSYTGESAENYYLYEDSGKLFMLPWDYSSAFGTYRSQDVVRMINYPIDTPLMRGLVDQRPMFDWIMKDQRYVTAYHDVLNDIALRFAAGSDTSAHLRQIEEMITPYVVRDKNKFSSETAFHKGVSTLISFLELRSKSVQAQLNAEIPSTYDAQEEALDTLIDAAGVELIDMK